jgi:hypothetical protein
MNGQDKVHIGDDEVDMDTAALAMAVFAGTMMRIARDAGPFLADIYWKEMAANKGITWAGSEDTSRSFRIALAALVRAGDADATASIKAVEDTEAVIARIRGAATGIADDGGAAGVTA